MTRGRRIGPLPGSALLEGANACEWSDGECPRSPVAAVATTHRHRGRRGGLCCHDSTGDDACPARAGAAGRGGPRAHGRDGDGDGGGRDPRRGDEPGLRRSALVVGGGGVRPLRGGGAARQRARGGRRHASTAADPRGRVRRGAADARVVAPPAAPPVRGCGVGAHGRRCPARDRGIAGPRVRRPDQDPGGGARGGGVAGVDRGGRRLRRRRVPAPQRAAAAVRARSRGGRGRPAVPGGDGRADRRPGVHRAAAGRRGGRPRRPGPAWSRGRSRRCARSISPSRRS